MIKIKEAVIVEGKYDKIKLENILDTMIITTNGFGIFNDSEKRLLLRRIALKQGLLIFTDSDSAGFMIRNFLKGCVPPDCIKHAYIPDVFGKEKRKAQPSKEGKLGVEGMDEQTILAAVQRAGVKFENEKETSPVKKEKITKIDFYAYGLSGTPNADENRRKVKKYLKFPENMSTNAMLEAINFLMEKKEFEGILSDCFKYCK